MSHRFILEAEGDCAHGRREETDIDADRFFRTIDSAILEHHSRLSGMPLILAALPEHDGIFHQISQNPFLMAEGLKINPRDMAIDELRARAWAVVEPRYRACFTALANEFAGAKSKGLGMDDLAIVSHAVADGRVATLLIEADRTGGADALDDLEEAVFRKDGVVVPEAQMPSKTGIAAMCRY